MEIMLSFKTSHKMYNFLQGQEREREKTLIKIEINETGLRNREMDYIGYSGIRLWSAIGRLRKRVS